MFEVFLPFSNQTRMTQIKPFMNSEATMAVEDTYGSAFLVREYRNRRTTQVVWRISDIRLIHFRLYFTGAWEKKEYMIKFWSVSDVNWRLV